MLFVTKEIVLGVVGLRRQEQRARVVGTGFWYLPPPRCTLSGEVLVFLASLFSLKIELVTLTPAAVKQYGVWDLFKLLQGKKGWETDEIKLAKC